jgi:hypothetical protein
MFSLLLILDPLFSHLLQMNFLYLNFSLIIFPLKILHSLLINIFLMIANVLLIDLLVQLLDLLLYFEGKTVQQGR